MDVAKIRERYRAAPFRPFTLVLENGRKLPVDEPYYLAISDSGRVMMHASLNGFFEKVSPDAVREMEDLNPADFPQGLGPPKRRGP